MDPHTFALTPLSETLRSDRHDSLRPVARLGGHPLHWQAWGNLLHSVRTGATAFDAAHGKSFFDALADDHVLSSALQAGLGRLHDVDLSVVEASDLGRFERMVDVGGGAGELSRQIASARPTASVILFDQPHVLAMAPAAAGVEYVSGDFLESVPREGDAYFLKFVLHDWDDASCRTILQNIRRAMNPGARVVIVEMNAGENAVAALMDLGMLHTFTGREREASEFRRLLESAGLEAERISQLHPPYQLIEAVAA